MSSTIIHENSGRALKVKGLSENTSPDVLIIGGGINGISAYRELSLQGLNVVLVEKGDYCSAASGALSRMIHGGLRYMETGEFKLVRESLQERNRLLRNAPHYVRPLATTVPLLDYTSGVWSTVKRFLGFNSKPPRRGAALVKIGLTLYDLLTWRSSGLPRHSFLGRNETFTRWPHMNRNVSCSATYFDAQITFPERLGVEIINDVDRDCPNALAVNYMAFKEVDDNGQVVVEDQSDGAEYFLSPKVVINASGAWVDKANSKIQDSPEKLIGGTKGSHLIVDNKALYDELGDNMIYFENKDGRVCILFRYFDKVLLGSTDIRVDDPDSVKCEDSEVEYILDSVRYVFPTINVKQDEIVYTFSGVRPLPFTDGKPAGQISRDHTIEYLESTQERPFPVLCLIGGKWTTFRAFGELAADDVLKRVGYSRHQGTKDLPIGGGRDFPSEENIENELGKFSDASGVSQERARVLLNRYGTLAYAVGKVIRDAGGETPLTNLPEYSKEELAYLIHNEDVVVPADLLIRRTNIAITGRVSAGVVREVIEIMATVLEWPSSRAEAEYERFRQELENFHRIHIPPFHSEELVALEN